MWALSIVPKALVSATGERRDGEEAMSTGSGEMRPHLFQIPAPILPYQKLSSESQFPHM